MFSTTALAQNKTAVKKTTKTKTTKVVPVAEDEEEVPAPRKKNTGLIGHSLDGSNNAPYGMAGCGLGSVLFGESDNRGGQVLAGTTNSVYSNNTFGMSSGTSNCVPEKSINSAMVRKNVRLFVTANKEALANDIVKSNGEALVTVSKIMNCEDTKYLGAKLQSRYETMFNASTEEKIADNIFETVSNDRYLVENCKL